MIPFENVRSSDEVSKADKPHKPFSYSRERDKKTGKFLYGRLDMNEGVSADIGSGEKVDAKSFEGVRKARIPAPRMPTTSPSVPKPAQPKVPGAAPKPSAAPRMPRPSTVPTTRRLSAGKPRIKETGIGKSMPDASAVHVPGNLKIVNKKTGAKSNLKNRG